MTLKKCTIVIEDEVKSRIGGLTQEHLKLLWNKFGIHPDGYRFMPSFQLGRWDGKQRFFSETGNTYTKLLEEIVPFLAAWDYDVDIEDKRPPSVNIKDRITEDFFEKPEFKFRPYQIETVNKLLDAGSGFALVATGGGKTSLVAALSAILYANGLQTIVIVPSTDLVDQTIAEFRDCYENFDLTVGVYAGDNKNIDHPIVVATWQALQNAPHLMADFGAFIVDESHGARASIIKKLIDDYGKHIAYRYGVTGTFPKDPADQYSLKCSIGQILVEIPASFLIKEGYLSTLEIEPVETQDVVDNFPDYTSEKTFLSRNSDRLEAIATFICNKQKAHGNTLVLVGSIAQGQQLVEMIPGAIFLFGESDKDTRAKNYQQYADRDDLVVIATYGIASTGLSINRIFCLIMVDAGKSFIKCIQTIGRGLRRKGDKNHVFVFDIFSRLAFSKKHFKKRKDYYQEAGYPLNKIVKHRYFITSPNEGLTF